MQEIVVATRNRGKQREIAAALAGLELNIISLADYPCAPEVEEDGDSFEENAIKKARACAEHTQMLSIADDSGLIVDALGGAPGVYSARYAGARAGDEENNRKLLRELAWVQAAQRTARFACVIALCFPDRRVELSHGACEGLIVETPRGQGGFGYDPIFLHPPSGKTFAQLTAEEKLRVSHRGQALRALRDKISLLNQSH